MKNNEESLDRLRIITSHISIGLLIISLTARPFVSGLAVGAGENALFWIFSWGAFLFVLLDLCLKKSERISLFPLSIPLTALLAWAFFSIVWAGDKEKSLFQSMIWLSDFFSFFSILYWSQNQKIRNLFLAVVLSCFSLEMLYVVYQSFIDLPGIRVLLQENTDLINTIDISSRYLSLFEGRLEAGKAFGHFALSNTLGGYILLHLPLVCGIVYLQWQSQKRKETIVSISLLFLSLLAFICCQSRGSFLCFGLVGLGALFWGGENNAKKNKRQIIIMGMTSAFSLLMFIIFLSSNALSFLGHKGISFLMRLEYWKASISIWLNNLLWGVGVGNFADHYYTTKSVWAEEVNNAHNVYLQWGVETGIIGIFLLLFLLVRGKSLLLCSFREEEKKEETSLHISKILLGAGAFSFFLLWSLGGSFQSTSLVQVYLSPFLPSSLDPNKLETVVYHLAFPFFGLLWYQGVNFYLRQNFTQLRLFFLCGLLAFLLHCFIDLNLYDPGLSQSFAVFLGLFASFSKTKPLKQKFPRKSLIGITVIFTILMVAVCSRGVPHLMKVDTLMQNSRQEKRTLQIQKNTQGYQQAWQKYFFSLEQILILEPFQAEANLEMAMLLGFEGARIRRLNRQNLSMIHRLFSKAHEHIERSYKYKKNNIRNLHTSAEFYLLERQTWKRLRQVEQAEKAEKKTRFYAELLLKSYPWKAPFLFLAGKIEEEFGNQEKALSLYQKCLYAHDMAYFSNYGISPEEKVYLLKKLSQGAK